MDTGRDLFGRRYLKLHMVAFDKTTIDRCFDITSTGESCLHDIGTRLHGKAVREPLLYLVRHLFAFEWLYTDPSREHPLNRFSFWVSYHSYDSFRYNVGVRAY